MLGRSFGLFTVQTAAGLVLLVGCSTEGVQGSPAACNDGEQNGAETSVDCGGPDCSPCVDGEACASASDCRGASCIDGMCRASGGHCENGLKDADESGTDCGGVECKSCVSDDECAGPSDCGSGVCRDGICLAETCTDNVINGAESDVDCGGTCDPCDDDASCSDGGDCQSGVCTLGLCSAASCSDGRINGDESDVDCGGTCSTQCEAGEQCRVGPDCETLVCAGLRCAEPACDDDQNNGEETGVDCGGADCEPCSEGSICIESSDCKSGRCVRGVCAAAGCSDGVLNGSESDVDCGGTGDCERCTANKRCEASSDCAAPELFCDTRSESGEHRCTSVACSDGEQNGEETDVDCGGECPGCEAGQACDGDGDCASLNCEGGTLCAEATCEDGIQNQGEGAPDCGGSSPCGFCGIGQPCAGDGDCESGVCAADSGSETICQAARCDDTVQNGDETDEDCGGSCSGCGTGQACDDTDANCVSLNCGDADTCEAATCTDGIQNQGEGDVDCGGPCDLCEDGFTCNDARDCRSAVCDETCQAPTCEDEARNGGESGTDCGGDSTCPRCGSGEGCDEESDCDRAEGLVCVEGGTCALSSCEDGVPGGTETGTDCGGDCPPCDTGEGCLSGDDCSSQICSGSPLECQAASCEDSATNGDETDLNCGGGACDPCGTGGTCERDEDCESLVCDEGVCIAPSCSDRAQNRDETDLNCGGTHCSRCVAGARCAVDHDCRSGMCASGSCAASPIEVYYHSQPWDESAQPDWIQAQLRITNVSGAPIDPRNYTLRYYYTNEPGQTGDVVWTVPGNVLGVSCNWDTKPAPVCVGAQCYLEFQLLGATAALADGASTTDCRFAIRNYNSTTSYIWEDDASWGPQQDYEGVENPWVDILVFDGDTQVLGPPPPY